MSGSFSRMAELPGLDGGRTGMAGFDVIDRDQGQAQVARFLQQAMERGLVGDGAMDDGGAVAVSGDGQPVEPGGPPGIEVPLEADLVPSRAFLVAVGCVVHGPNARSGRGELASPHVGIEVMIRDRRVRVTGCGSAAGRVRRPGGPRPGGWLRRAWRRCAWCESAPCSGTP